MASKCTPDIGNHLAFSNRDNLPGALYSLKSFKCMFAAVRIQANDLPKMGTSEEEQRG